MLTLETILLTLDVILYGVHIYLFFLSNFILYSVANTKTCLKYMLVTSSYPQ